MQYIKRIASKIIYQKKGLHTLIPSIFQNNANPIKITKGNDCILLTDDHKEIIDFTSSSMVVNLGHNNKYIFDGFQEHLNTGIGYVSSEMITEHQELLSERLINITKNTGGKVFYTNTGADANKNAIFLANEYQYNNGFKNKSRSLSFKNSFHEGSDITVSFSNAEPENRYDSLPIESIMENPCLYDNGFNSLKQIRELFRENDDIASIIIEGSSSIGGCILYPSNYLNTLQILCKQNNVLIICDEIVSGWGRTGHIFAYMKNNIKPDIITSSNGLTNGYSQLGTVIINKNIADMYNDRPFLNGLIYSGHPLYCSIANRCLDLYLEDNEEIIKYAYLKGTYLNKLGDEIKNYNDIVSDYRNNGLLGCIELNIKNKEILSKINNELLEKNIFCFMRENYIFTAPPLTISLNLMDISMAKINDVMQNNYMHFRY